MKTLIVISILFLSGCSTISGFLDKAADANDELLKASKFGICQAASIRAILEEFGSLEKYAEVRKLLCVRMPGE